MKGGSHAVGGRAPGAAMESNHPIGALLRPAGFEARGGFRGQPAWEAGWRSSSSFLRTLC
jgi:hypothetical protein